MIDTRTLLRLDPRALASDPDNVRREGPVDLESLASSIREHGLLQPIGVAHEDGGYRVVFGNRRREAAIMAGLGEVPCVLVDTSHDHRLVAQLLENLQRRDLNDMDKAAGLLRLRRRLEQQGVAERELDERVAQAVGMAVATVRRYLGLLDLAPGVRDLIAEGELGVTHAQHLKVLRDAVKQEELAHLAAEKGLSAAALGKAARILAGQPAMTAEQAVSQGARGADPLVVIERAQPTERVPRAPRAAEPEEDDWEDDDEDAVEQPRGVGPAGPSTQDGHRVFRIKSVGAFVDEVDRLARSLQDGDLARAAGEEPDAPIQLRLAQRQLGFVAQELERLLKRNGWGG